MIAIKQIISKIGNINTKRSHRVIQFFLKRSASWCKENRDFSIYWSTSHMTTTAQIMRLLAISRNLDADFCAIAGAIHDIATMETGKAENHAVLSFNFIRPLITEFNEANKNYIVTDKEIALLEKIISQHSDKEIFSDNLYVEILKDADALDRYLHGVETKETEMSRLLKVLSELGIQAQFEM